jgi:predicted ester cyclase
MSNKELSRRFTELFRTDSEVREEDVFAPDVVFHGTRGDGELQGIDAMKEFIAAYRRAFPEARSTVEDQVAEGDKVVTRWRARSPDFEMDGVTIERLAGDRIAEIWVARDELGLMRQLGLVPEAPAR